MSRMIEYINPQPHAIQLSSPEKKLVKIPPRGKVILSEWYMSYCPKYLRVVRILDGDQPGIVPREIPRTIKYSPSKSSNQSKKRRSKFRVQNRTSARIQRQSNNRNKASVPQKKGIKAQIPKRSKNLSRAGRRKPVVGRPVREDTRKLFTQSCQNNQWSISNNIGVGILSYNRVNSLKRLIASIRRHTDMSRTTIFVSDDSTDFNVKKWLKQQTDLVVLVDQPNLGIAGNSNRLLRCLSRFKHGLLLNDDVEVLRDGWDRFYAEAANITGYHHFCYRQLGVYGAKRNGRIRKVKNYQIETITDKPHGAVMSFTHQAFERVGFFDEQFGPYGMEHVDWSERIGFAKLQLPGFHDIIGSEKFFKIHKEKSLVPDRSKLLRKAREAYQKVKNPERVYVEASARSHVPSLSVIIPVRNIGRQKAVETVVNSIKSQLFPNIELIIVEQDRTRNFVGNNIEPHKYFLAKSKHHNQPFTKAMAFNLGVEKCSHNMVVLQDADIICPSDYLKKVHYHLLDYEGVHLGAKVLYISEGSSREITTTCKITPSRTCERAIGYFEGGSLGITKSAYIKIGGFNEVFEGYGIEDCDFFDRMKHTLKFYNTRSIDFIHLWHGRTPGWNNHHKKNKKLFKQLKKQYPNMAHYISNLVMKLKRHYPGLRT